MPDNTAETTTTETSAETTEENSEQEAILANPLDIQEPEDYESELRAAILKEKAGETAPDGEVDTRGTATGETVSDEEPGPMAVRAKELGFSDEQIASFGGEENLGVAVAAMDAQIAALARSTSEQTGVSTEAQGQQATPTQQPPTAPPVTPPVTPPAPSPTPEGLKLDFDEDIIDPQAKALFEKVAGHFNAKVGALEQEIVGLKNERDAVASQEIIRDFERFLANLTKEEPRWKEVFGEGATHTLDPNGMAAKERKKLFAHADALGIGYVGRGLTVPDNDELNLRAVKSLYAEKLLSFGVQAVAAEAKKRAGQRIGHPSRSKGGGEPAMTAEQKAVAHNLAIIQKHGYVQTPEEQAAEEQVGFL